MNTFLPSNFSCEAHLANNPYEKHNFSDFNIDNAIYILGLIERIPARNKDINDIRNVNGGYTPLCAKYMQSYVNDYKKYIAYFLDTKIIETDGKYVSSSFTWADAKCYGYKFTSEYQGVELVAQNYSKDFEKKLTDRIKIESEKLRKSQGHLIKWLWPVCNLEINSELAFSYIKTKKIAQLANPDLQDEVFDKTLGKIQKKDPVNQYNCAFQSIHDINSKDIHFKQDDTVNRFHTNLTNIKSELRNLLTYNGETLYSIDVTCSQPYLTLALFNPHITILINDSSLLKKNLPILEKFWKLQNNTDVKNFKSLVSKNQQIDIDFYTYIQDESKANGLLYKNRSKVKTGVFEVLFSKNAYSTKSKIMFKKLFPTVDKLYREIKSQDNSILACLLQQIEAYIIIEVITKKIASKFPEAPLFTIHDSIVTTEYYKDFVQLTMERELKKLTKYKPKLKVEKWTPQELDWKKYQ